MANKLHNVYPRFYEDKSGDLYAFLSPDRCFHLCHSGWGKAHGFEFRIYRTRATVLKKERMYAPELSFAEFKLKLSTVFSEYILEIQALLPLALLEAPPPETVAINSKLRKHITQ